MLGSANKGENGFQNQKAGDQTGVEVYIKPYYIYSRGGWNVVFRHKDPAKREIIAKTMEDICRNDHIGYDYNGRNTLMKLAKKCNFDIPSIKEDCETDCSAATTVCCMAAGLTDAEALIDGWNCMTTYVMRNMLRRTNKFTEYTDVKYLTSDKYLLRGDIILNELNHVEVNLTDGVDADKKGWDAMNIRMYIAECYTTGLLRNASKQEIDSWEAYAKTHSPQEVMNGIFYSKEGIKEWITTMYKLMLGRKPESSGLEHWTKQMQNGKTRGDILSFIKESEEYKKLHGGK